MSTVSLWTDAGVARCACCGARYEVKVRSTAERVHDYARCDRCETVMDEWISSFARQYTLIEERAERAA